MKKPIWKYSVNMIIAASCILYLIILYYFTIGKSSGGAVNGKVHAANLIPFKTVSEYFSDIVHGGGRRNIAVSNLAGNVLLTIPLAVYIAYFRKSCRKLRRVIGVSLAVITAIEMIQFFSGNGTFDIDDVLLNLAGAVIGYGFWKTRPVQWLTEKCQL